MSRVPMPPSHRGNVHEQEQAGLFTMREADAKREACRITLRYYYGGETFQGIGTANRVQAITGYRRRPRTMHELAAIRAAAALALHVAHHNAMAELCAQ